MRLWNRLGCWLRHSRLESDLTEEIRLHRELLEEQFLGSGVSPREARHAAARAFGSETTAVEQSREEWSFAWIDAVLRDLHFAWRLMVRQPLLTAAAMITLAFGIGANTAIVSVLDTILINPLGLRQADKVMIARVRIEKLHMNHAPDSGVEFREIQSMTDTFSSVAAMEGRVYTAQVSGEPMRLTGRAVSSDFFEVFGESPAAGRFFLPEDREGVVLSNGFWRSQFGGDPLAVGRTMILNEKPQPIIGVAPVTFRFPAGAQIYMPLVLTPDRLQRRSYGMSLYVFAHRREGVSPAQAADRINRHVVALKSPDSPESGGLIKLGYGIELDPISDYIAGDLRRPLWLLWAAALVVLFCGCANVAGLLLTRSSGRRKEMAIRLSLGATRLQIVRQLFLESLLLGTIGGVAGLVIANFTISFVAQLSIPSKTLLGLVSLNGRLLLFGLGLALMCSLLFGSAPALQLLRDSRTSDLARSRRRRFQDLFVTAEVCGAFVLLVMTVLLLRSLWTVEQIQPGFDPRGVTTAFFSRPQSDPGLFDRLRGALRTIPGVQSAALGYPLPFTSGGMSSTFSIRNRNPQPGEPELHGEAYMISPGYLETLRIPLLLGRNLADSDTAHSPTVCLVDSKFAQRFFPGQNPLGQEIAMYNGWARIVGIVGAIRGTTLEEGSRPVAYYPLAQMSWLTGAAILVRSDTSTAGAIREVVRRTNAAVPVYDVKYMEERIRESLGIRQVMVNLFSVFGAISLLLATVGIYGVVAQVVGDRTQEIGIRMALGARPVQIVSLFMRQGLRSGLFGLALGVLVAAYAQTWVLDMLYGIKPFDPATFCVVSLGILSFLSAAVWWPARRAARVDPQESLRCE